MSEQKLGQIRIGRHTKDHGAWLKNKGYEVTEVETTKKLKRRNEDGTYSESQVPCQAFQVKVNGFVESSFSQPFELGQDPIAALKGLVEKKQAFTYETRIRFPDGAILFGTPACAKLGPASALVMSQVKAQPAPVAKPKIGFDF